MLSAGCEFDRMPGPGLLAGPPMEAVREDLWLRAQLERWLEETDLGGAEVDLKIRHGKVVELEVTLPELEAGSE